MFLLIEGFSVLYDMWNQVPLKRLMTAGSSNGGVLRNVT